MSIRLKLNDGVLPVSDLNKGLVKKLKNSDMKALWLFLTTHGMWLERKMLKGELYAVVDENDGRVELEMVPKNVRNTYKLIKAIENNPLFHLGVDRIRLLKTGGEASPWGAHIRVKRGEIPRIPDRSMVRIVSPLVFHATTSGLHRLGRSYRLIALQSALGIKIANAFFGQTSVLDPPTRFLKANCIDEEGGALASLASWILRVSVLDEKAIKAELTTHVIRTPTCEEIKAASQVLKVASCIEDLELEVIKKEKRIALKSGNPELYLVDKLSGIALGRLVRYTRVFRRLEGVEDNSVLVISFSEQMGPIDVYLILTQYARLGKSISKMWLIGTPLTFPMLVLTYLYTLHISEGVKLNPNDVEFAIGGEEPFIMKNISEALVEDLPKSCGKLVYLAQGPTALILSMGMNLVRMSRKKDYEVELIPL